MKVLVQPVLGEVSILMRLANSLEDLDIFSLMFDLCCFTSVNLHYYPPRIMAKKMGRVFFRSFQLRTPQNKHSTLVDSLWQKKSISFGHKRCTFWFFVAKKHQVVVKNLGSWWPSKWLDPGDANGGGVFFVVFFGVERCGTGYPWQEISWWIFLIRSDG